MCSEYQALSYDSSLSSLAWILQALAYLSVSPIFFLKHVLYLLQVVLANTGIITMLIAQLS